MFGEWPDFRWKHYLYQCMYFGLLKDFYLAIIFWKYLHIAQYFFSILLSGVFVSGVNEFNICEFI